MAPPLDVLAWVRLRSPRSALNAGRGVRTSSPWLAGDSERESSCTAAGAGQASLMLPPSSSREKAARLEDRSSMMKSITRPVSFLGGARLVGESQLRTGWEKIRGCQARLVLPQAGTKSPPLPSGDFSLELAPRLRPQTQPPAVALPSTDVCAAPFARLSKPARWVVWVSPAPAPDLRCP